MTETPNFRGSSCLLKPERQKFSSCRCSFAYSVYRADPKVEIAWWFLYYWIYWFSVPQKRVLYMSLNSNIILEDSVDIWWFLGLDPCSKSIDIIAHLYEYKQALNFLTEYFLCYRWYFIPTYQKMKYQIYFTHWSLLLLNLR